MPFLSEATKEGVKKPTRVPSISENVNKFIRTQPSSKTGVILNYPLFLPLA